MESLLYASRWYPSNFKSVALPPFSLRSVSTFRGLQSEMTERLSFSGALAHMYMF